MEWNQTGPVWYLLAVNLAGLGLYALNLRLPPRGEGRRLDLVLLAVCLLGGALGAGCGMLLLDRRAKKENMLLHVAVPCAVVIQAAAAGLAGRARAGALSLGFGAFFGGHRLLPAYLVIINVVTFLAFGVDKRRAVRGRRRVRIVALLGLAFAGGSAGGLLGMHVFRHKLRKDYFALGLPLMLLMHITVIFYWMNR